MGSSMYGGGYGGMGSSMYGGGYGGYGGYGSYGGYGGMGDPNDPNTLSRRMEAGTQGTPLYRFVCLQQPLKAVGVV